LILNNKIAFYLSVRFLSQNCKRYSFIYQSFYNNFGGKLQYEEYIEKLVDLVHNHNVWRRNECINMIASENITSKFVDMLYNCDAKHRYAEGYPFKRYYQGTKYIDEIEVLACGLMSKLFNAKYVDLRPISGTIANASAFKALGKAGDMTMITPLSGGGHVSHSKYGVMGALGYNVVELPFDNEELNIDLDKATKEIRRLKPVFIVLGGSLFLFPHPVKEIGEVAKEIGSVVIFDAAHVLGLIAGKKFPNPLEEGADLVTSSTHKTFPGPQGGVIMSNNENVFKPVRRVIFPVFVSNHHLHRLAATAGTALEMLYFGEEYANQILLNSKKLAEELYERGFNVLGEKNGFTRTHQVAIDVSKIGGGAYAAKRLEEANIIVNKNMLPWDTPDMIKNPSGLRLGVQEITRIGMKEDDMVEIANFFERVLLRDEDPTLVKKDVIKFRKDFTEVQYTFDLSDTLCGKLLL